MTILNPKACEEIETFILEYSGISLANLQKKGVWERIERQIKTLELKSAEDYLFLLRCPSWDSIRDKLIAQVTVNETFFFRNPAQFRFLVREFFPGLLARKNRFRVWSAACSTGEEVYSLAHISRCFAKNNPEIEFSIVGSDINKDSIANANVGLYRKRSLRKDSLHFLEEFPPPFLREIPKGLLIEEPLRNMVQFKFLNLHDLKNLKTHMGWDIIFCRNVLIYFEISFRVRLIETLFHLLNDGGMLFLGETEGLPSSCESFELVKIEGAYGYRKLGN